VIGAGGGEVLGAEHCHDLLGPGIKIALSPEPGSVPVLQGSSMAAALSRGSSNDEQRLQQRTTISAVTND
jgi:hypothetical protein